MTDQVELKKRLKKQLKLPDNALCADCRNKGPTWCSYSLGLFLCMDCAGVHRKIGTHITKVRSTTLDDWKPEDVDFVSSVGNRIGNTYWEYRMPQTRHIGPRCSAAEREDFIRSKYQHRHYYGQPDGGAAMPTQQQQQPVVAKPEFYQNDAQANTIANLQQTNLFAGMPQPQVVPAAVVVEPVINMTPVVATGPKPLTQRYGTGFSFLLSSNYLLFLGLVVVVLVPLFSSLSSPCRCFAECPGVAQLGLRG